MPFLKKAIIVGNKVIVKIDHEKENCPKQANEWIKIIKRPINNILHFFQNILLNNGS